VQSAEQISSKIGGPELINLVGNAIKFTDAGGVVVKAVANNGSFQVSVRDTGPGILLDQS
jgi:signal transduction histidine kinase